MNTLGCIVFSAELILLAVLVLWGAIEVIYPLVRKQ
jgi:hypothetical protein